MISARKYLKIFIIYFFLLLCPLLRANATEQTPAAPTVESIPSILLAPTEPIDKKSILTQKDLYQITDMLPNGNLIIEGLLGEWEILEDRFKNIDKTKFEQINEFFVGKFIKIYFPKVNSGITLPIELYSPLCFSDDPQKRILTDQCPVILQN